MKTRQSVATTIVAESPDPRCLLGEGVRMSEVVARLEAIAGYLTRSGSYEQDARELGEELAARLADAGEGAAAEGVARELAAGRLRVGALFGCSQPSKCYDYGAESYLVTLDLVDGCERRLRFTADILYDPFNGRTFDGWREAPAGVDAGVLAAIAVFLEDKLFYEEVFPRRDPFEHDEQR